MRREDLRARAEEIAKLVTLTGSLYGAAPDKTDGREVVEANREAIESVLIETWNAAIDEVEKITDIALCHDCAAEHGASDAAFQTPNLKQIHFLIRALRIPEEK